MLAWQDQINSFFSKHNSNQFADTDSKHYLASSSISGPFEELRQKEEKRIAETKEWLRQRLLKKVGTSSWKIFSLKILSILVTSVAFANVFGEQNINAFFPNASEDFAKSLNTVNNGIFTVSTYLGHSIYILAQQLEKKYKNIKKLYKQAELRFRELSDYYYIEKQDIESGNFIELELIGDIIATAFDKVLKDKNLNNLKEEKVVELSLTMIIALYKYQIKQGSDFIASKSNTPLLLNEQFGELISSKFAQLISSVFHNRSGIKNLVRGHKPKHVQLKAAPTVENFMEAIKEAASNYNKAVQVNLNSNLEKYNQQPLHTSNKLAESDYSAADDEQEPQSDHSNPEGQFSFVVTSNVANEKAVYPTDLKSKGKEIDDTDKDLSGYNSDITLDSNPSNKEVEVPLPTNYSLSKNDYDSIYRSIIEENKSTLKTTFTSKVNCFQTYTSELSALNSNQAKITKVYKFLCAATASIAVYNPLNSSKVYGFALRYAVAAGTLLASYFFYRLYDSVKELNSDARDIYSSLKEVVLSLYSKRLIQKVEGKYVVYNQVEEIHNIINKTIDLLEEQLGKGAVQENDIEGNANTKKSLNQEVKAKIIAMIYTELATVLLEKIAIDRSFSFQEKSIDIAKSLALVLAKDLARTPVESLIMGKNPGKYNLNENIFSQSLESAIKFHLKVTLKGKSSESHLGVTHKEESFESRYDNWVDIVTASRSREFVRAI